MSQALFYTLDRKQRPKQTKIPQFMDLYSSRIKKLLFLMAYKTVFEASKTKAYKWGFSEIELPDSRIYTSEDGKVE